MQQNKIFALLALGLYTVYLGSVGFLGVRLLYNIIRYTALRLEIKAEPAELTSVGLLLLLPLATTLIAGVMCAARLKARWFALPSAAICAGSFAFLLSIGEYVPFVIMLVIVVLIISLIYLEFMTPHIIVAFTRKFVSVNKPRNSLWVDFLERLCGSSDWHAVFNSPRLKKHWVSKFLPRLILATLIPAVILFMMFTTTYPIVALMTYSSTPVLLPLAAGFLVDRFADNYSEQELTTLRNATTRQALWVMRILCLMGLAAAWIIPNPDEIMRNLQAGVMLATALPLFIPRVFLRLLLRIRVKSAAAETPKRV